MSVLAKKIKSGRSGRSPISQLSELGNVFVKEFDSRMQKQLSTIVESIIIDHEVRELGRVMESIALPAMLAVIEVENAKHQILVNISSDLSYHILDMLMGGDPGQAATPMARSNTDLDFALSTDAVTAITESFQAALGTVLKTAKPLEMRLNRFEPHATLLTIAPDHADVLVLKASVDIGEAARSGEFEMVVPLTILDLVKSAIGAAPKPLLPATQDTWSRHMIHTAAHAQVPVHSVLHRLAMDIGELEALVPGQVIALPPAARGAVELTLCGTKPEHRVAMGRLGALSQNKAIKLTEAPDPGLTGRLSGILNAGGTL
ncbi:MAG: FliM/FliN family flagellar motor switch protein [Pseudomonadota bacterium]